MEESIWKGRFDGDEPIYHRLFQKVQLDQDYDAISKNAFAIHGFSVDEGVRRNKGRQGAKNAPDVIRRNMSNFPVVQTNFNLFDFGNVYCENQNLEASQENLAQNVSEVLKREGKSIVIGGGHEVTFAHYSGVKKAFPNKKIGIINFDAHFDNRIPEEGVGASSGTGFWQIAQEGPIHSIHIGIQKNSNTLKLFDIANEYRMKYILADQLYFENVSNLITQIDQFLARVDVLYLTICMDVFNAAIAPGVSALAYNGIFADPAFLFLYRHLLKLDKMVALDVAEVNPEYDQQERTARLAASLLNEWLMTEKSGS